MKLSIIIPVYNAVGMVGKTLDSIYSQGLDTEEFEVICVDDCSTDNSVEMMEAYAHKLGGESTDYQARGEQAAGWRAQHSHQAGEGRLAAVHR